jgi:hypothetical protein
MDTFWTHDLDTTRVIIVKLLKLARPEGFEPPTPRSVVRSSPQSGKPAKGKSLCLLASPLFCCGSIYPVLYQCGNRNGNNLSQTGRRFDCSFGQRNQPAKVLAHFFGFVWSTFRVFALAKFVGSCVEGHQWRDTSGKMPLSSLTMESDATNGIPEGLAICQSPMCNVRFEQTGMKVKPIGDLRPFGKMLTLEAGCGSHHA